MTDKHPAAGARIATGIVTGLALVGMVTGYQSAAAAEQASVTRQSAPVDSRLPAEVTPAAETPTETAPAPAAPAAPAPAAPAPAAPAQAPAAPAPAPAAPAPAAPAPAPQPPVNGTTGGS